MSRARADRPPDRLRTERPGSHLTTAGLLDYLDQMFPPDWLRQTTRDTNVVKRERKVDPAAMF